jgi:hypothetical protein
MTAPSTGFTLRILWVPEPAVQVIQAGRAVSSLRVTVVNSPVSAQLPQALRAGVREFQPEVLVGAAIVICSAEALEMTEATV